MHSPERRIFGAALVLVAAVLVGLGLGAGFSPPGSTRALAVPAFGFRTLLTVGALPRRERLVELRPGLTLLGLHLALASLPLAAAASSSTASWLRLCMTTGKPALTRRAAMGLPMMPRPMKPMPSLMAVGYPSAPRP